VVGRASERCDAYIGAHYDSVEAGPGANDNASGTAAMLELARTHRADGLCAIAFGSEENGLHGSRAFVRAHDVEGARFMLNFDMVAKISSPFFVATTGSASSRDLADRAAAVAMELAFDMPRGAFPRFASSDHESFSAADVPAITVHSGDDPLIHDPRDDLDNVSRDDLATMLNVAAAVLRALIVNSLLIE
jgi:aminopeptidase YwaD